MAAKHQHLLLNFNRLLIYILALTGLFLDYTWAYVFSLTLWVWLSTFIKYERQLIEHYAHQPFFSRVGSKSNFALSKHK